ncbi:MAG: NAD(P)/FAD-dependent oxidoreductase [Caulobacteraceae bacterium]
MELKNADVEVVLIDRRNHHVFQPLLYQVATAGLGPAQIASPIRSIMRDQGNARVILGEVEGVDIANQEVVLANGRERYDYLVLATGATHAYFGRDDWRPHAPGLKSLEDAIHIRRRVLLAFEGAELTSDPVERDRLLTFVIVGGGPTGVELAGAIAELAKRALTRDFHRIRMSMARVVLVEAGPRILATFPEDHSSYARRILSRLGVEVHTGAAVTECDVDGVEVAGERIGARTIIWAAGVRASPAGEWLSAEQTRAGKTVVGGDLSVAGAANVFVIGDVAHCVDANQRTVPAVAPAAKQQGRFVGRLIRRELAGDGQARAAFAYSDHGSLATIGRKAAAVSLKRLQLTGASAWVLWSLAHIYFLIGFRNRIVVTLDWVWSYFTFERGSRLITGEMMD